MTRPAGKKRKRGSKPAARGPGKAKKKTAAESKSPVVAESRVAEEISAPTIDIVQIQALAGATMLVFAIAGIVGLGAWLYGKTGGGTTWWTAHALIRAAYAALIAVFLWNLIRRRWRVSFILVLGCLVTAIFVFHGTEALKLNQEKIVANQVLGALREGWRRTGELTPGERENPYVDAYIVTRNIYWELNERADARMAEYSSSHEQYTRPGGFLAPRRLRTQSDLLVSHAQLRELDRQLSRIGQSPIDTSNMLWSLDLLRVDIVTRIAYRNDLRATLATINQAHDDSIARERRAIARTLDSIEVLLDAEGRYHIEDERVVFDDPADAVRFSGKIGATEQSGISPPP
jgi:hypothetical protein